MVARPLSLWPALLLVLTLTGLAGAGCSSTLTPLEKAALKDPTTVALYNGSVLTLDEFEARYARTVGGREAARNDSLAAYQEFLDRYVNFRLKVLAAEAAGYTEDPSILSEIDTYRASFARPYLIDKEVMNPILSELYERSKEMVEASHILLRVRDGAPPADTLAAYEQIMALRDSVAQGVDFGDLAVRHSQDPSAQNPQAKPGYRGWLGYFSAGRMVKAFEDQAFTTPVGSVSQPFRSQFGYHLVYVHDRREAIPEVRISHLMVRIQGTTPPDSARALERIQGYKARIEAGEDFARLAEEFSEERNSARQGGDLGFLRYDNYAVDPAFREAAFAMEDLNTLSDVVTSAYGYHLFMITERKALGSFEDEYDALERTASRLPRLRQAEVGLAKETRARYAATIDTTALLTLVAPIALDTLMDHLRSGPLDDAVRATPVATLADSTYTFGRLVDFARIPDNLIRNMLTKREQVVELADVFLDHAAISHEAALLESRDDEFRLIMEEFRDGLVLFKLMEDSVWTAAAQDSAGLAAHYEAHKDAYRFPDRTRIIEIYSYSDALLDDAVKKIEGGMSWDDLQAYVTQDSTQEVILDTMLVEGQTNSVYDQALNLAEGARTEIIQHRTGYVVLFNDGIEPARPKTMSEARAEVVNDYQQVLEDRLLERLRAQYRVHTFPERLAGAYADEPEEAPAGASASSQ